MTDEKPGGRQLGRGLSALFGDDKPNLTPNPVEANSNRETTSVPIEFVRPNPNQPRRNFDPEHIESLVASIKERGILQPILVRKDTQDPSRYEIVAGERRWRAAQTAQLHEIPIIIKVLDDKSAFEIALIENIQREDLNPLEEAEGYRRLVDEFSHTQEAISQAIGKSRSHIANMMRLLKLPGGVKQMLIDGELSMGHARALLNTENAQAIAHEVVKKGLSVRQTEKLISKDKNPAKIRRSPADEKDPNTVALETDLSDLLGLKVSIKFHGEGGELVVRYNSLDQLDEVLHRLKSNG